MPKTFTLPEEIYVYRDDTLLLAEEDLAITAEEVGESIIIGTYKLVHEAKYAIDKTIVEL